MITQPDCFACIILAVFLLVVALQLLYYGIVYMRVAHYGRQQDTLTGNDHPAVSVIICARNEDTNLSANLPSVLEQDYPLFEVIVVNDCSEDDTEQILAGFRQQYPHLRSTIIKRTGSFRNSRKFAATVGVKAAQYEWLLFTDADCRPDTPRWIASVSRQFRANKEIVLGYGGYTHQKGYLSRWIRYDACFTSLQYFGFALAGMPYMGVSRNLAYRRSLFDAHNGFAAHAHIASSDDLLVNQAATRKNVAVVYTGDSQIHSLPPNTFSEWFRQKRTRDATSRYYKKGQRFLLGLEPFSRVLLWASFCVLTVQGTLWPYVLGAFLLRKIMFLSIFGAVTKRFREHGILSQAIFFDLAMPFICLYIFLLNKISSKNNKWK